jgi:two-component SAPR family response regulator
MKDARKTLILIVDENDTMATLIHAMADRCRNMMRRADDVSIMKQTDPVRTINVMKTMQANYRAVMLITSSHRRSELNGPGLAGELFRIFEDRLKVKLLLTSDPERFREEAARNGMDCLAKPFDNQAFTAHIERFLKRAE